MNHQIIMMTAGAFLWAGACSPSADNPEAESPAGDSAAVTEMDEPEMEEDDAVADMSDACPVIDSRNWSAWVNAMPGPDAKITLHVTGEIDLPTPGYEISWQAGMADRSMTPVQRLMLTLTPPDGMVAQVITTETVKYEGPALVKTYGGVIVMCGGEALAEIDDVTLAQ